MTRRWWLLPACLALALAAAPALGASSEIDAGSGMSLLEAAVLGLVEGLTEYLPVSSTGHLLVTQRALGIGTDGASAKSAADAFAICIQAGAILAVLGLYLGRVRSMARGLLGRDVQGGRLARAVLWAFLPAAALGFLFADRIKENLFGPWPVVLAWAVGGAAILCVAASKRESTPEGRRGRSLGEVNAGMALAIGLAQCLALWPGVSRSLVTIVAGVVVGLSLPAAVEFSFLLGLLTLTAATAHDAIAHGALLAGTYSPASLVVGFAFACGSAVLAVRWMVSYLQSHGLRVFGYYRLAIALVVAILLERGWL